jgi:hypothetical protein
MANEGSPLPVASGSASAGSTGAGTNISTPAPAVPQGAGILAVGTIPLPGQLFPPPLSQTRLSTFILAR